MAGAKQQGKKGGEVNWHGGQSGTVCLSDRKLKVTKPRMHRKGQEKGGEVPIPACEQMQAADGVARRMLEMVMRGVSTRNYHHEVGSSSLPPAIIIHQ